MLHGLQLNEVSYEIRITKLEEYGHADLSNQTG